MRTTLRRRWERLRHLQNSDAEVDQSNRVCFPPRDGLESEIGKDQDSLAAKCPTENAQRAGMSEVDLEQFCKVSL